MSTTAKKAEPKPVQRVAIYCRKSTEEGLDQEFNSLDAQRQSCEMFAASQKNEGWDVIPEHFDDGVYCDN
jgi:site-specific DNA recombinase